MIQTLVIVIVLAVLLKIVLKKFMNIELFDMQPGCKRGPRACERVDQVPLLKKMEKFLPFINPPAQCIESCKESCNYENRKSLMNPNCDLICPVKCRRSNNPYNENLTHYS